MYSSFGTQGKNNVVGAGVLNSLVGNYFDCFVFFYKTSCHITLSGFFITQCTTV